MVACDKKIRRHYPAVAEISDRILYNKAIHGFTVGQICDAVGMSAPTFNSRIKDPRLFQVGELIRLAKLFGVSVEELVLGVRERGNESGSESG